MSTQIATIPQHTELTADVRSALKTSLYPGANDDSVGLVLAYCRAARLDPMTKPVHIVPMWDSKARTMRDVVMPGIGLYRTIAARSGCAGVSEPEFGPDVDDVIGGIEITYPKWCKVTVRRQLESGAIAEFTARELWLENYAEKGGQEKSPAPNAMWRKRPYGQLAKCAEAQALRKAFPEVGAMPTAEEMEGKAIIETVATEVTNEQSEAEKLAARKAVHDEALARHSESVAYIKERIAAEDWPAVSAEWNAISQDDQMALWLAHTKGGVFTTAERKSLKEMLPVATKEAA